MLPCARRGINELMARQEERDDDELPTEPDPFGLTEPVRVKRAPWCTW
jgi:hypothetical protein